MPSETLKGFNYRDYGVEFGPIIKLIGIKIYSVIHPTGVLAIGVDDRTLVAEGSDVFVNTAQALSLLLKQYLTCLAHLILRP
jgi:hypothetical protein